jgi:hypothetical protein
MIPINKLSGRMGNQMFQFAYIYSQWLDGKTADVYLQDPSYFDKHRLQIRKLYNSGVVPVDRVAIHIRRGDYVNNPFYADLSRTNYYQEAMKEFPEDMFLVFSDDIEFAKTIIKGGDVEYSTETDEVKDFNLMAGCKGHIIANSSFSWWAAYISPYTKKVIAPKAWYADMIERTKCPHNWLRL